MCLAEWEKNEGSRDGRFAGWPWRYFGLVHSAFRDARCFAPDSAYTTREKPAPGSGAYLGVLARVGTAGAAEMWKRAST